MQTEKIYSLVNPENPYAMVGSGSSYNPNSVKDESDHIKTGMIVNVIGTAVILTSSMTHGLWADMEIKDSEIGRGLEFYRPLSLNSNVQVISNTLSEGEFKELHSVQDQIKTIAKSLNPGGMSGLAALLHVSRPTIYKWLDEKSDIKLENQNRLASLFSLAEYWNDLSSESLMQGSIRRRLPSGTTLFEILTVAEFSMGEAKKAIEILAKSQNRSSDALNRFKDAISSS